MKWALPAFFYAFCRDEKPMSDLVVDKVKQYCESILPEMGLELFDIQFRQEGSGWVLRIFIDNREGVSIDHCTEVSREISAYLEVDDIIEHAYNLEISSPGLERPLRRYDEFARFTGSCAKVKLHHPQDGQKVFIGDIGEVIDGESITLLMEKGEKLKFSMDEVNNARLYLK